MATFDVQRRYERIEIELGCRLFIPEATGEGLRFQSFNRSQNLGLGGVFITSSFLLKPGLDLWVELELPDELLAVQGRVAHVVDLENDAFPSGMGIEFLEVDAAARESLLRFFAPARYHEFYGEVVGEFPHLAEELDLQSVSLVVNLWEEWKITQEGGPRATASGAPPALSMSGRGKTLGKKKR